MVQLGIIQLHIEEGHWAENRKHALHYMNRLAANGAQCLVLPEMWTSSDLSRRAALSEFSNDTLSIFQTWAQTHRCFLIGSQLEKDPQHDTYYNTAFAIGPDGALAGQYRKSHLFVLGGEANCFSAGTDLPFIFETPWGLWSVAICFDLRFPVMFRRLAKKGVSCFVIPAQWPLHRRDHWLTLLKARAIENQCIMIGANRLGTKGKDEFHGASAIFDPWGKRLCLLGKHRKYGLCTVDTDLATQVRRDFPSLFMDHPTIDEA